MCVCVCVCVYIYIFFFFKWILCLVTQSCPILCDPMGCSPSGSSVLGILQPRNTWVGCHLLLQESLPDQGWNPHLLRWQAGSLPLMPCGKPAGRKSEPQWLPLKQDGLTVEQGGRQGWPQAWQSFSIWCLIHRREWTLRFYLFLFWVFYLFIWLHQVLVVARRNVSYMWDLVPWPGIEPQPLHWELNY